MIDIKTNPKNGNGFDTLHTFENWKVAFITYAEQYGKLKTLKRHLLTDETFTLIKGNAKLYTEDNNSPLGVIHLEKNKVYVVKKNTWHHLQISKNALLLVVENSNTSKENTESKNAYFK